LKYCRDNTYKTRVNKNPVQGVTTEKPALQRQNYITFKRCWACVKLGFPRRLELAF